MWKWPKRILIAFASVALLITTLLGYSYFVEPSRLVVNAVEMRLPNFSPTLNGFKIVAISDIHGGSNNVDEGKLRQIVERANAQDPDLIVLLGDHVSQTNGKHSDLRMPVVTIANNLAGFRARHGVFAVIGNHDWWYDEKKVRLEFEKVGIRFLENELAEIHIGGETIWLWGIEDYWKRRRVPAEPIAKLAERRNIIAITHNPDSLLKAPADISLMLAGHSHGGQVEIPFYGRHPFVNDPRFMFGKAIVDGKHIFVTTGIGCTGPQIRFRTPPEIAVLTLIAEK